MDHPRAGVHYPASWGEFQASFPGDADCLDYLDWLRWPEGFVCPRCAVTGGWARWPMAVTSAPGVTDRNDLKTKPESAQRRLQQRPHIVRGSFSEPKLRYITAQLKQSPAFGRTSNEPMVQPCWAATGA